ncbi:hypothetical protein L596_013362 [Steinernema carpocapsae]|uniref:Cathepsin propeptide inhibitor domain-containing protein n=1 Tax=Steinernema carpocapsae TaxID=34508 RepID=A0A4U5NZY0_STECR|nr:hypothetical protein L596_013362 [Steinernema carpocapsae]
MIFISALLLLPTLIAGLSANAPAADASRWEEFVETHKKEYSSGAEESKRFQIFRENLEAIQKLNDHHQEMATFEINQFVDLNQEEFAARFNEVLTFLLTTKNVLDHSCCGRRWLRPKG